MTGLTATVCGSFRRAMPAIQEAVEALRDRNVTVLSPADPRVVDQFGDFLFVASDRLRTIRLVENRHLAAISASAFVWLVTPDGYVGPSAAMELGYAHAKGVSVFSLTAPSDLTLRQYVEVIASVDAMIAKVTAPPARGSDLDALLDPLAAVTAAHTQLEIVHRELLTPSAPAAELVGQAADRIRNIVSSI
jgi:hypothetical protein